MRGLNLHHSQLRKDKIVQKFGLAYLFAHLDAFGISPNLITAIGKFFGLLSLCFLFVDPFYFALFYILHQIMDGFDGSYARFTGRESKFGHQFDHLGDLAVHSLILIKSIFTLPDMYLASIALITYIGEFLILYKLKLDDKKFPTSNFAIFYLFGSYEIGLLVQIAFQIVSLPIFLYMNRRDLSGNSK